VIYPEWVVGFLNWDLSSQDSETIYGLIQSPDARNYQEIFFRSSYTTFLFPFMPFDQELLSLPHGPEFRFLSEMIALERGVSGSASYTITGDEPFLKGHFPEQPMWPGVIMIESIAQLGGVIAQSDPAHPTLDDMRLTSVRNAKILGTAFPGAVLTIEATVEGRMGNLIQVKGTVSDADTKIAEATIMLSGT